MCWTEPLPWFLPKGWCAMPHIMFGVCFIFFLNSTALWNPFLECQTYYDKSQVLQANPNLAGFRDGWYAIWELAHVSLWMESGNVGLPPMKFPPRVMRLMRTHPNSLHRRLSRAWKKGTGYPARDVGGCERDKLQPSRVVSQAFRGTWNESTQRL